LILDNFSGLGVREFRVQEIHEGYRHDFRYPPARAIGASGDQEPATASFLNPEP
jgi:hypothetical protein